MNTSSRAQVDRGENLREQLPRRADERPPGLVLVRARRFADAHQVRVRDCPRRARDSSRSRRAGTSCTSRRVRRSSSSVVELGDRDRRTARGSTVPTTMPTRDVLERRRGARRRAGAWRHVAASPARGASTRARRRRLALGIGVRRLALGGGARRSLGRAAASRAAPARQSARRRGDARQSGAARRRSLAALGTLRSAARRDARSRARRAARITSSTVMRSSTSSRLAHLAPLLEVAAQLLSSVHRAVASTRSRIASATSRFGMQRQLLRRVAVAREERHAIGVDAEARARLRRVVDARSGRAPSPPACRAPFASASFVSSAKPTMTAPAAARRASSTQDVGRRLERDRRAAPPPS